ncbi:hypothetical protein WJX84_006205 [Apatococcus fuscideae]|uniref:BZIP domain-containing protein n=1 Tax=Apatococcus fuscideae TaxID=2026836 RepID=A0AAW1SV83_9CHLO
MQPHFPIEHAAFSLADLERHTSREQFLAAAGSSWGQGSYDASLAALLFPEISAQPTAYDQPIALDQHLQPRVPRDGARSESSSHCLPGAGCSIPTSSFAKAEDSPEEASLPEQHSDDCDEPRANMTAQQLDEERAERLRAKNRHAQQRYRERKVKYRDSQKRYRERQKDAKQQQAAERQAAQDTIARLTSENNALNKRSDALEGALSRAQSKLSSTSGGRTIIAAESGLDPSLEEGMAVSINLRGPCLLTQSQLLQMTLDQHFDLNKALKQKLQGSLNAVFHHQADHPRSLVSCRQLESSFAEFIFMTRAAGAVQPQRARQLLALNLETLEALDGDDRLRLCTVLAELNLTSEQKLGVIAARDEYLQVLDLLQLKQQQPLTEWVNASASHLQPLKLIRASCAFNSILKDEYRAWDEMQVKFYTQILNVRQAAMVVTLCWPIHPDIVLVASILEEQLARPTCLVSMLSNTESEPAPPTSLPGLLELEMKCPQQ